MENRIGLVNNPVVFLHYAADQVYEVEIVQQVQINAQYNYFVDITRIEDFVCDKINAWVSPVDLKSFSFFNFSAVSGFGESFFEVNGYIVTIRRYNADTDMTNKENDILDFNAFLNKNPGIDDGSGEY